MMAHVSNDVKLVRHVRNFTKKSAGFSEYNDLEVKMFFPECECNLFLGHLPRLNILGRTVVVVEPKTFF